MDTGKDDKGKNFPILICRFKVNIIYSRAEDKYPVNNAQ
jgi:methyl-accepting chemotaxis protein